MPLKTAQRLLVCLALGLVSAVMGCRPTTPQAAEPTGTHDAGRTLRVPEEQPTLAAAVSAARPGDTIELAAGNFEAGVLLPSGVTLRGAGDDQTTLWSAEGPVLRAQGAERLVVEDLRIQGKRSDHAVVSIHDSNVEVRRVEIVGKGANDRTLDRGSERGVLIGGASNVRLADVHIHAIDGDGVDVDGERASVRLDDARLLENKRGLTNHHSSVVIDDSTIRANKDAGISILGGRTVVTASTIAANEHGVTLYTGAARIAGSQIQNNRRSGIASLFEGSIDLSDSVVAANGRGVQLSRGSRATLDRSIVAENRGCGICDFSMPGWAATGTRVAVRHNVVFANHGPGIAVSRSALDVADSIVFRNEGPGIVAGPEVGNARVDNSIVWGNPGGNLSGTAIGPGVVEEDPLVLDADAWDFRLQRDSPGRGGGTDRADIGVFPRMVVPSVFGLRAAMTGTKAFTAPKSKTARRPPRNLAVVVGISNYRDRGVVDLKGATADANAVADFLEGKGYEVRRLTDARETTTEARADRSKTPATLRSLRAQLVWLSDTGPDDRILFYFSGHGSNAPNPLGHGHGFLLPLDADPGNLAATALPLADLRRALENSEAENITLILDTCFAAGAKSVSRPASTKSPNVTDSLSFGSGTVALFSSGDNEPSLEYEKERHGYFTYFLLAAWRAEIRSAEAVYRLVYDNVKNATDGLQSPQKEYLDAEGELPTY